MRDRQTDRQTTVILTAFSHARQSVYCFCKPHYVLLLKDTITTLDAFAAPSLSLVFSFVGLLH